MIEVSTAAHTLSPANMSTPFTIDNLTHLTAKNVSQTIYQINSIEFHTTTLPTERDSPQNQFLHLQSSTVRRNLERSSEVLSSTINIYDMNTIRSNVKHIVDPNKSVDSVINYETFVYVFYGVAILALMLSMCFRRSRFNPYEVNPDKEDRYEDYMKVKDRVHKISVMQKLKQMKRLWNAPIVYKLPVHIV